MESLERRHRQEKEDIQSRIVQKKKSATKKTRKGINDECEALERQLNEKQALEISELQSGSDQASAITDTPSTDEFNTRKPLDRFQHSLSSMSLSSDPIPSPGQAKKPNRQKARLARRAAEQEAAITRAATEASDLPNLRDQEREAMRGEYARRNLTEREIRPDGHCLYSAIADQLTEADIDLKMPKEMGSSSQEENSTELGYRLIRQAAASYIFHHPDDFVPFLEQPFEEYVTRIRETAEWGGHLELTALAQAYGVTINVLQGDGKVEKIGCGKDSDKQLWLAYYRHSFGLGEHYNSLRRSS